MDDGYALLRAIEANPDEDTPRLVFADWLEERAEDESDIARAEFIRVQVRLTDPPADLHEWARLLRREEALLRTHRRAWEAPLAAVKAKVDRGYSRGFPEVIEADARDFVWHGGALPALVPFNGLRLQNVPLRAGSLSECPTLRYARKLYLHGNGPGGTDLSELFAAPYLENVTELWVFSQYVNPASYRALADAELPRLTRLWFEELWYHADHFTPVLGAKWFDRLTALDLGHPAMDAVCERGAPGLVRLGAHQVNATHLLALASPSLFPRLRHLEIKTIAFGGGDVGLPDPHVAHLRDFLRSPTGQRLARLAVRPPAYLSAVVEAELPALEELWINVAMEPTDRVEALASSALLSRLRRLTLAGLAAHATERIAWAVLSRASNLRYLRGDFLVLKEAVQDALRARFGPGFEPAVGYDSE